MFIMPLIRIIFYQKLFRCKGEQHIQLYQIQIFIIKKYLSSSPRTAKIVKYLDSLSEKSPQNPKPSIRNR